MGFVYLMNEVDSKKYKIGLTKKKDITKRAKQLQTGNSVEIELYKWFETDYPHKLEKMLHHHLHKFNIKGEWFELDDDIVNNFTNMCVKFNDIITLLKRENPFY